MNIPQDLLTEYQRGCVLIFIGQGINGDEWSQLGSILAERLQDESLHDQSTSEVAQEYLDATKDRRSLIQIVRDFYETHTHLYPIYHQLATLNASTLFVTTCFDDRLEYAFDKAGRKLNVIVTQIDRGYGGAANEARLYKLHGTIKQPDTLRLTSQDLLEFYYQTDSLPTVLKGQLADNTILFVGFALDEEFFQQLYLASINPLDRHFRRAYALGGPYSRKVERFCERNQISLIRNEPADFFASFLEALQEQPITGPSQAKPASRPISLGRRPYKKLFAYGPDDEELFFGRRQETEQVLSLIQAYRLVVLHGPSGIGKSSLLGAGIVPYLTNSGYKVIMIKAEGKELPGILIRREIANLLPEGMEINDNLPLLDYLSKACEFLNAPFVILLDQFEDFFIHLDSETRVAFTTELAQALKKRMLAVKWLLSIRAEWYSELSDMKDEIPDIFKGEFRLKPLAIAEVRKAIERPAQNVGMDIEPGLVDRLLEDLGPEVIQLPQLQLVCDILYDNARNADKEQLLVAQYEALGGTEGILTNYLNDFLRRHSPEQAAQIRNILSTFVTSEGTVVPLSLEELARETHITKEALRTLLHELENERLISEVERGAGQPFAYQLAHSYLVSTLAEDPEIRRQKAIRELLEQEVRNWEKIQSLMSREKLVFLRGQLGNMGLSEKTKEVIFRSAVQNNEAIQYWINHIDSETICAQVITDHLIPGKIENQRPLAALSALSYLTNTNQFKPLLAKLTFDPSIELKVRHDTAITLDTLSRDDFLAAAELALETSPERRQIILEAINSVQSTGIELACYDRLAHFKLKWPLRRFRLRNNRPRRNTIMLFSSLGGTSGATIGGLAGGIYSFLFTNNIFAAMPEKILFASILAAVSGLVIGLGIGFGLGTVEAMGERRLSNFYITGVVLGVVIPATLFGAADVDLSRALLGAVAGIISGSFTGSSLAIVISLTRNISPPTRRLVIRIMLGMIVGLILGIAFGFATHKGLASTRDAEGAVVAAGAPYGFGFGLLIPPFIVAGIELAERRLAKT